MQATLQSRTHKNKNVTTAIILPCFIPALFLISNGNSIMGFVFVFKSLLKESPPHPIIVLFHSLFLNLCTYNAYLPVLSLYSCHFFKTTTVSSVLWGVGGWRLADLCLFLMFLIDHIPLMCNCDFCYLNIYIPYQIYTFFMVWK